MARQQQPNPPTHTKPGRGGLGRVEDQGPSDERNAGRAQEEADEEDEELDDEDDLDEEDEDEDEEA